MRAKKLIVLTLLAILLLSAFACGGGGEEEAATPTPTPTPESMPTIACSPFSLYFEAIEGGANPTHKVLKVWNSGSDALEWWASTDATWLTLQPASGTATYEKESVTISVDISGLSVDEYTATITIEDPGATNSPQTVSVNLDITAPPWPEPRLGKGNLAGRILCNRQGLSATVQLYDSIQDWRTGFPVRETSTDEFGNYLFGNILPGSQYIIMACPPKFEKPPTEEPKTCWYLRDPERATVIPIFFTVLEGETTVVDDWYLCFEE